MTALAMLLEPATRPKVVEELALLIDATVANQSGLTGMALKSALNAAKKADADAVTHGVNRAMPQLTKELEPYWAKYKGSDSANFGAYLSSQEDEVVAAVLDAGDAAIKDAPGAIQKVYSSMRGKAAGILGPALPEVGQILEKYAG